MDAHPRVLFARSGPGRLRSRIGRALAACMPVLLALLSHPEEGFALEHNLASRFEDPCSPPQTPYLSFRSSRSEDMLFYAGGEIEIVCQAGLRSSGLRWTLHRNMVQKSFREGVAEALLANRFRIRLDTSGLHAGFYDLRVELDSGVPRRDGDALVRRPVTGVCTFGWKPGEMPVAETRPADFTRFWDEAKAKLARIPLDVREGPVQAFGPDEIDAYNLEHACLPPDFDPAGHRAERVESRKVEFAGPDGGRVYGWLAKPEGEGPFPAMLVLPGAGFSARPRPLEHARHGYLALDIQVHGQDVDLPEYVQIPGYYRDCVYNPVEKFYYYNIHLRCLQAVNYLASRPDVDTSRIVVAGGSQGGRLTVVVAGLDRRIAAAVPAIPHAGNWPHLRWVTRLNGFAMVEDGRRDPALTPSDGMDLAGAPPAYDDPADRCMAYYDPMNFARDARCPVMFNAGLIDPVSPPYSAFASFLRWGGADKTMLALDGLAHDWCPAFDRRAFRWLDTVLAGRPE